MSATREVLLGYHAWIESASKGISVAGFLVTNHRGIPIEFRYTDPVEMTETQRMLYGETNHEEALAVTMAATLWKSVQQKPRIILVEDFAAGRLWEHLAGRNETWVAHLHVASDDMYLPDLAGRAVLPVEADGDTMAAVQSTPAKAEALAEIQATLSAASATMRLDEPFERIEAILKGIHDLQDDEHRRRSAAPPLDAVSAMSAVAAAPSGPAGVGRLGSEDRVAARLNQINAANSRAGAARSTAGTARQQTDTPRTAGTEREATEGGRRVGADARSRAAAPGDAAGMTRRPDLQWMYRNQGE
ncbi:MAG: hypothetical protein ABGY41_12790 [Candidatus Poribacteria bacterium]